MSVTHPGQTTLAPSRAASDDGAPRASTDHAWLRRRTPPQADADGAPIPIVDLFSGCGGLTIGAVEGARRCGRRAELNLAVDLDDVALGVLQRTLAVDDGVCVSADLSQLLRGLSERITSDERSLVEAVPEDAVLLAGPPCQGHSTLNNHTRHDDPRNDLYLAVARAARLMNPAAVIIENVRGVGNDRRAALGRCVAALEELGYAVTARHLDLHQLGVPQRRVRHVVVATRDEPFEWRLADLTGRDLRWAIHDLLRVEGGSSLDSPARVSEANRSRIRWLFEHDEYDLPNDLRPACHQSDHSYLSMYGRMRWDMPAQTITSGYGSMGQGRYVHPERPRTLTPHEAARLQFIPDFVDLADVAQHKTRLATIIGNVAPPKLSMALTEALLEQELL